MAECPDDEVRRYPPAAPPAGAGAPPPVGRMKPAARDREGQPTQVDPNQANLSAKEKAEKIPPPGVSGPEAGPAS
jgi:hypothetical protein